MEFFIWEKKYIYIYILQTRPVSCFCTQVFTNISNREFDFQPDKYIHIVFCFILRSSFRYVHNQCECFSANNPKREHLVGLIFALQFFGNWSHTDENMTRIWAFSSGEEIRSRLFISFVYSTLHTVEVPTARQTWWWIFEESSWTNWGAEVLREG